MAAYAGLSVMVNLTAWIHGAGHTMIARGGYDPGQEVWFLASAAHSVAHFENPLLSSWINVPTGVNLADMTSMPLVGLLFSPITLLFGPILAFNAVMSFAFFSSATAMMLVARRWITWLPAAFLAGLIYGFSPYMVGQVSGGHLFLVLTALFPVMFLVLSEILVAQQWRWWLSGGLLGLLVVAQLFVSPELLIDALTLSVLATCVLAVANPRRVLGRLAYALKALAVAAVVVTPLAVWFAAVFLFGPGHVSGAIRLPGLVANLSTNVAGLVVPSTNQQFNFGWAHWADSLVNVGAPPGSIAPAENGSYLGLPLLVAALGGTVMLWRRPIVRVVAALGGAALLISLGSHLRVAGHVSIVLPFELFTHLALLNSTIAIRWSLFVALFVALLVAIAAQAVWTRVQTNERGMSRATLGLSGAVVLLASLFALIPPWPNQSREVWVPAWFTSSAPLKVRVGSTLLTYPMSQNPNSFPMLWQAINGLRYRLAGGYAGPQTTRLGPVHDALVTCTRDPTLAEPPKGFVALARSQFHIWHLDTIVVPDNFSVNEACAVKFFTEVTGLPATRQHDALVWTNLSTAGR